MTSTIEQLEEIEARAKAATQGTWKFSPWHIQEGPPAVLSSEAWVLATTSSDSDAAHIAGMDPATTLALTAALRQAWEERDEAREAVKALERPTMYWPDGECSDQLPEDFLESEYQLRGEDEWEEEFGNEGVMEFMCAHYLPHVWVAYRRHPDGFVTSEHKTEAEARAALKEPTHD